VAKKKRNPTARKLTITKVRNAIPGTQGIINLIATKCDIHRKNLYNFLEKHPQLREDIEHEKEQLIDIAEGHLSLKVRKGDLAACRFLLSTKGKKRGYTTKQELEVMTKGIIGTTKLSTSQIEELMEDIKEHANKP